MYITIQHNTIRYDMIEIPFEYVRRPADVCLIVVIRI